MKIQLFQQGGLPVRLVHKDMQAGCDSFLAAQKYFGYEAKRDSLFYMPRLDGSAELLAGMGDVDSFDFEAMRRLAFRIAKWCEENKQPVIQVDMPKLSRCNRRTLLAMVEGFYQASYRFSKKTDEAEPFSLTVNYNPAGGPPEKLQGGLSYIENVMEGVFFARDLVNETSNRMYPETLAQRVTETFAELPVEVKIYNRKEIEEIGMEAFLAVASGSDRDPRLLVLSYNGNPDVSERLGLVGKGLTYDSGGYCIKPPTGMEDMHSDMGGAATALGTLLALAKNRASVNVTVVVAACENLISGHAYKTGDIIGSLSGKTIEVKNTDAEGRLTLADAVYYATKELRVDKVIDLATLTGACMVALGEEITGAVTNDQELYDAFARACNVVGEKVWQLPADDCLRELNHSKVADLINIPGHFGGASAAGLFVGEFLSRDIPWLHLDIAGSAYAKKARGYLPERATGIHVKALCELLQSMAGC